MPTWAEVQEHLRAKYVLSDDKPAWLAMVWQFGSDKPQLQSVRLERIEAFNEAWFLMLSDVCPEAGLDAKKAMEHSSKLAIGAVALERGRYIVRHAAPLATLAFRDLERALEMIALEAARMRTSLAADPSVFSTFSD